MRKKEAKYLKKQEEELNKYYDLLDEVSLGSTTSKEKQEEEYPEPPECPPFVHNVNEYPELLIYYKFADTITPTVAKDEYLEFVETCHHYYDILPEERMRDVSRPGYNPNIRPPTPDDLKLPPGPAKDQMHPIYPLAYCRLLELQIMMPNIYLTVEQLTKLIKYFPDDIAFLRAQVIMSCFSHIIDQENMYILIDKHLTYDECNEMYHRIGILNLLDPMNPDRLYRLDLRRNDQREWCKIITFLAVAEPGDNWTDVEYRWGKFDAPVPGWTLPGNWNSSYDDGGNRGGPRTFGRLKLAYRSHGEGCMPLWGARKHVRKRTLAGIKREF